MSPFTQRSKAKATSENSSGSTEAFGEAGTSKHDNQRDGRQSKDSQSRSSDPHSLFLSRDFDAIVTDINVPQFLRDNDSTLRFPEKLLLLILQAEREAVNNGRQANTACLAWTTGGRAIVLRQSNELLGKILPLASFGTKFLSLTRKLYRWGFRQVPGDKSKAKNEKIFCHPLFQRDNIPLMVGMKSTTAETTRRALTAQTLVGLQESRLPGLLRDQTDSSNKLHQNPHVEQQPPPLQAFSTPTQEASIQQLLSLAQLRSHSTIPLVQPNQILFPGPDLGMGERAHGQMPMSFEPPVVVPPLSSRLSELERVLMPTFPSDHVGLATPLRRLPPSMLPTLEMILSATRSSQHIQMRIELEALLGVVSSGQSVSPELLLSIFQQWSNNHPTTLG